MVPAVKRFTSDWSAQQLKCALLCLHVERVRLVSVTREGCRSRNQRSIHETD